MVLDRTPLDQILGPTSVRQLETTIVYESPDKPEFGALRLQFECTVKHAYDGTTMERGFWQFFQGSRDAKPGEFCTAVFWRNDRMISISGPGCGYKGALLSFVAIDPKPPFPRSDKPGSIENVKVTLKQCNDAPATITAFNRTLAGFSDEIRFAVSTIDAALAGIEDNLAFRIDYQGQEIFALAWHSGFAAREVLNRCLAGQKVDGSEAP